MAAPAIHQENFSMPIAPGQIVNGRYKIIRLLGQGGFGAVYQAHDQNLDRPCALKENLETSSQVMRQFTREAQLLANLSHPNLPRVIDHFVLPGQGQYLVMDYVEGEDLEQMLARTGKPLPVAQALDWIGQVCDALIYLHHLDPPIIHRDIKPGNIRITPRGQAMLVDFGIAKLYDSQSRTTVAARAFTPGYSPPEQYGKGVTDERSDIYALGATLYTLLTNQTPPDSVDLLSHNAKPPPLAHQVNPQVPEAVGLAIAQAMQPERERRFQSVEQFKRALFAAPAPLPAAQSPAARPFQAPQPGRAAPPPPLVIPPPPRTTGQGKQGGGLGRALGNLLSAGLGMALLALLLTFGVVLLMQRGPTFLGGSGGSRPTDSQVGSDPGQVAPPTLASPPTLAIQPSDTPLTPPEPGAIRVAFPTARIAFASDHSGDRKDRIYVYELQGGEYWLTPVEGAQYRLARANPASPFVGPAAVPIDETQERAWWPEWCDGNRILLFEGGDRQSQVFQTLYALPYDPAGQSRPSQIVWSRFPMLGVPRCANRGSTALASARLNLETQTWQLHWFDASRPREAAPVGDGFLPFAGYASFSGDDSWLVLMHKDNASDPVYRILEFSWADPRNSAVLPLDARVFNAMYPSISPLSGQIAYACELEPETRREPGVWGLCLQNADGRGFQILEQAGRTNGLREGYNRFHVFTPRWSADGRWLAYASPKSGDWDIYLYLLDPGIEINLTADLGGDQFQPSWSKP
jgi:hypothetical protein